MGKWVLLQMSTTEAQEAAGPVPAGSMAVGDGRSRQRAPCRSSCHSVQEMPWELGLFSPFSLSWNRAGCDFWMLAAGGTLSQEVGGEEKPCFWQRGSGELPAGALGANRMAMSGYQQVALMNGQLHMMGQIDHCITRHNLLISAKRAIHYRAHHRDTVIPTDNIPDVLARASYHPNMLLSCRRGGEAACSA